VLQTAVLLPTEVTPRSASVSENRFLAGFSRSRLFIKKCVIFLFCCQCWTSVDLLTPTKLRNIKIGNMVVDESKIPFGGDTGRVKSYMSNNRVTNLDEVGEALNFGAFSTLLAGVCVCEYCVCENFVCMRMRVNVCAYAFVRVVCVCL